MNDENKSIIEIAQVSYGKVTDRISRESESYSRHTLLRSALQLVPIIGSSIDTILSGGNTGISEQRFDDWREVLGEQMRYLDEKKADKQFIESEEFSDLVRSSVEAVVRARSALKRETIARLIKSAVEVQDRKKYSPEDYLYLIEQMTEPELMILHFFYEKKFSSGAMHEVSGMQHHRDFYMKTFGITIEQAVFHRNKLVSLGLLDGAYSTMMKPNDMMKTLMTYIMESPKQPS